MAASLPSKVGYVRLGRSGLKISKVILGTMTYGDPTWGGGWVLGEDQAMEHFAEAWKLGINTWDTADVYSNGASEVLVGKAIRQLQIPRDEIVVLTKLFFSVDKKPVPNAGYVNLKGSSRKHIFDGVKASLERLQLDYVDVLQLHRFDSETPIEETMEALHDVVKMGYARYIGMSSCYAWQFSVMQNWAINNNKTPFISMQDFHNAIYREEEREMFPTLDHFGVGAIPWSPLARGYLTRPVGASSDTTRASTDPHLALMSGGTNEQGQKVSAEVNSAIEMIAKARGFSMAQVALAWSLSFSTICAPIVGTTRVESLRELVQATHIVLTKEEIASISGPYRPREIGGH